MSKLRICLPLISAFAVLGPVARSEDPALGGLLPASGTLAQSDASSASPSDWSPPAGPLLSPSQESEPSPDLNQDVDSSRVQTDGATAAPSVEWRPAADSSQTDAAAQEALGPRVDLAGPGTPKWKVITYVSQKTTLDDNLYISHADKQSDVSFAIAPGFAAGWGDFRSVLLSRSERFSDQYSRVREAVVDPFDGDFAYINYNATAAHYLSHDSLDAIDQDGSLAAQWDFTKLLLGLDARFQTLSGADIDLGGRARRTVYTIDLTANYPLSDKLSLNFQGNGEKDQYVSALDSSDLHGQLFLNYQAFPKTSVGAGFVVGVRTLQTAPDQDYQQALLQANYDASGKLSINANGGVEVDEAAGSTRINPVFGIGANYRVDDQNTLSLNASRSTSSSAVTTGETLDTTGFDLEVHHRIYSSLSIELSLGFDHSDYYQQGLSNLVRTDNYYFFGPRLSYDFAQWSEVQLAYEYHHNASTQQPFDFIENIASLEFNFVF